jgi:hypothetical protein
MSKVRAAFIMDVPLGLLSFFGPQSVTLNSWQPKPEAHAMSETKQSLEPPDLRDFDENRRRFPLEKLIPFYGQHVAWSPDGTQILASGKDIDDVEKQLEAAGYDPSRVVLGFVPPPEMILLGGLTCDTSKEGITP